MRKGGSYTVGDDHDLVQREEPTRDHPNGNRARPAGAEAVPEEPTADNQPPAKVRKRGKE